MAAAAAVIPPSGLEDGVSRARGEGAGEAVVERGPGAAYHMFVVMEDLVEKLKLLRYEEELLRKNNLKPPSRCVPRPRRPLAGWAQGMLLLRETKTPRGDPHIPSSVFLGQEGDFCSQGGGGVFRLAPFVEKVNTFWNGREAVRRQFAHSLKHTLTVHQTQILF